MDAIQGGGIIPGGLPKSDDSCVVFPPVIDGAFTDWEQGCTEWTLKVPGVFGDFYVAFDQDTLMVLNDWHLRDEEAVEPDMYNLFQLACPTGQLVIRVYGDQHIEAELNGESLNRQMSGATGFEASPNNARPHAIFEFAIESAEAASCVMAAHDPENGTGTPEEVLQFEPTLFAFNFVGGKFNFAAATAPKLIASTPQTAAPGEEIVLLGGLLGPTGDLRFGSSKAEIISWSEHEIRATVPAVPPGPVTISVMSSGQLSNSLVFFSECAPQCNDKACGADGCGGICGVCSGGEACDDDQCVCVPSCAGKQCGDDGCGGSCGDCYNDEDCVQNQCVCVPSCAGKQCGDDGCNGSCGTCSAGFSCDLGQQCVPDFN